MKKFDLNTLGVQEMGKSQLIEVNGGRLENPWWNLVSTIVQTVVILDKMLFDAYIEASKKGFYEGMPSPSFRH